MHTRYLPKCSGNLQLVLQPDSLISHPEKQNPLLSLGIPSKHEKLHTQRHVENVPDLDVLFGFLVIYADNKVYFSPFYFLFDVSYLFCSFPCSTQGKIFVANFAIDGTFICQTAAELNYVTFCRWTVCSGTGYFKWKPVLHWTVTSILEALQNSAPVLFGLIFCQIQKHVSCAAGL